MFRQSGLPIILLALIVLLGAVPDSLASTGEDLFGDLAPLAGVAARAVESPLSVPAVPVGKDTARADEVELPPLLIRWPLRTRSRQVAPPVPTGERVARARRGGPKESGLVPPQLDTPPARPRLKPPAREREQPRAREDREPVQAPRTRDRPEPRQPVGDTEPAKLTVPEVVPRRDGPSHDTDIELFTPFVAPARVAVGLGVPDISPPTREVPRWTRADEEELSYEALDARKEGEWIVLRGQVDIHAGAERIQADEVRLHEVTHQLIASGNVVLDHADARLTGSRMEYDVATNTGTVWDALGYTGTDLNFTGARVEKIADDKYVIYDGTFTSCSQPLPIWHIRASKAIIHVNHFVYTWNPRILFKKVPAYYLPWAAFPINQTRSTGFMIPKINFSSSKGTSIEEEFFWAINRSLDITVGGQWWSDYGQRGDLEARWHLNNMPNPGFLKLALIFAENKETTESGTGPLQLDAFRWQVKAQHKQKLWDSWDLTIDGEAGSDQLVDREFDPDEINSTTPIFKQKITMQRRWGKHSLNVWLENQERETSSISSTAEIAGTSADRGRTTTIKTDQNLPTAEYRLSGIQLGGRKWASLSMNGSLRQIANKQSQRFDLEYPSFADAVFRLNVDNFDHSYSQAELSPKFTFPISSIPFLEVVPSVSFQGAWFSKLTKDDSDPATLDFVDPEDGSTDVLNFQATDTVDESAFLWYYEMGLRLGGPDFQRIYKRAADVGKTKWQHLIEPSVDFSYSPGMDLSTLPDGVVPFSHGIGRRNEDTVARASVTLVNTLRSKEVVAVGESGPSARDVVIWSLKSNYDFREPAKDGTVDGRQETSRFADITSDVNFKLSDDLRFTLKNTYDILQDDIVRTSLGGTIEQDWGYVNFSVATDRNASDLGDRPGSIVATGENWFYKEGRIRLGYDLDYKLNKAERTGTSYVDDWPYRKLIVSYYNQCCGVSLSWEHNNLKRSGGGEKEWTFLVSLKDLGNYLRYRKRKLDDE